MSFFICPELFDFHANIIKSLFINSLLLRFTDRHSQNSYFIFSEINVHVSDKETLKTSKEYGTGYVYFIQNC